jgi:hypothetical protein
VRLPLSDLEICKYDFNLNKTALGSQQYEDFDASVPPQSRNLIRTSVEKTDAAGPPKYKNVEKRLAAK